MKRLILLSTLALLSGLIMAGSALAVDYNTVGGNDVVDRGNSDAWTNTYTMDTRNPFTADGSVNQWEIWAKNTQPVELMIYRVSGSSWTVVGRSGAITPSTTGYNKFTLSSSINVLKGDFIGFHFTGSGGCIAYDVYDSGQRNDLSAKVLFTDPGGSETAFKYSSDRVYSIKAYSTTSSTNYTVGGNSVIDRGNTDSWTNTYTMDRNNPFSANGIITRWEFWAKNTEPVELMIYRTSGSGWTVVNRSGVVTPNSTGLNRFNLNPGIAVQQGDFIGLHFTGSKGSVAFDIGNDWQRNDFNDKVLLTDQGGGATDFKYSSDRVYSIRAFSDNVGPTPGGGGSDEEDKDHGNGNDHGQGNGNHRNFGAHLKGDNTHAQGQALFRFGKDGDSLRVKLIVANIEDVSKVELHRGSSQSSEVVMKLFPWRDGQDTVHGRFSGVGIDRSYDTNSLVGGIHSWADLRTAMENGEIYIDVHTNGSDNPEIGGHFGDKATMDNEDQDENAQKDDEENVQDQDEDEAQQVQDNENKGQGHDQEKDKDKSDQGNGKDKNKDKGNGKGKGNGKDK